jgi:prophage maintenance system killer protein
MTIQQAKVLDMVDYLSQLGHKPAKVSGHNYWYRSPFHDEKTPSFKINKSINRWYDFSEGKGGNLVDFGIIYHRCSIHDFLTQLDAQQINHATSPYEVKPFLKAEDDDAVLKVIFVSPVNSYALKNYLLARKIEPAVSDKYCCEVAYSIGDKSYYAIGFKNDAGGYELRNPNFKASSSPKDVTFVNNGAKELTVFEGFFNFLSYESLCYKNEQQASNFLVLNSTSFFEKSTELMQRHERVHLFLDNDRTGLKFTTNALALDKNKFKDQRQLYRHYNDLNDWLINKSQSQKLKLKH